MSISRCTDCGALVDTDEFPEYYREEYEDHLICDECMEDRDLALVRELEERGRIL